MEIKEQMKLHKWAQDMAEQKASGLSQKKWCEMKGIGTTTYEYRCRRVRKAMEERIHESSCESTALVSADKPAEPVGDSSKEPFFAKINLTPAPEVPSGISVNFRDTLINIAPDTPDNHVKLILEVIAHA